MQKTVNVVHLEGYLYEHDLKLKTSGPDSKHPGTPFISGSISVATDDAMLNVVPVHFTYVASVYGSGKANSNYPILLDIFNDKYNTVMSAGADKAAKIRIDTSLNLNDFYSDKTGEEVLVSVPRNEGGFIHIVDSIAEDEKQRNMFKCDTVITNVRRLEADPEKNLPEKMKIKGAVFGYQNVLLPMEFTVTNPNAMNYFEGLEPSAKTPVFTQIGGREVSEVITKVYKEESAFGEPMVREVKSSNKAYLVTWAKTEPYVWDDESSITAVELSKAMSDREIYLATVKQRYDEYKKTQSAPAAVTPTAQSFQF